MGEIRGFTKLVDRCNVQRTMYPYLCIPRSSIQNDHVHCQLTIAKEVKKKKNENFLPNFSLSLALYYNYNNSNPAKKTGLRVSAFEF